MTSHYSPLRYPGGKNCIFPFMSKIFYENRLLGINYAEPYAGGAGLALRLLIEGYVNSIYINDYDRAIYAFWKTIIEMPEEFSCWVKKVEISVKNWTKYKEIQKHAADVTLFELAKSTFFLNRTNISGVIKGGVIGGIEQKGKYKIDARFNKTDLIQKIQLVGTLSNRITVSNLEGIAFLEKMNRKKEEVFIYLDPPYYQKGADLYMNYFSKKDHEKLSKYATKMKQFWMISYDNHDFILNLFSQQKKIKYRLSQSTSNRVGDEVLIFSDKIDYLNAMKYLSSPSKI